MDIGWDLDLRGLSWHSFRVAPQPDSYGGTYASKEGAHKAMASMKEVRIGLACALNWGEGLAVVPALSFY
jgi:hypothetical protein